MQRCHVVTNFLSTELRAGRVFGPVEGEWLSSVHINRFGLVPKAISLVGGGL